MIKVLYIILLFVIMTFLLLQPNLKVTGVDDAKIL